MVTRAAVRARTLVIFGRVTGNMLAHCCTVMGLPGIRGGNRDGYGRLGGRSAMQVQRMHGHQADNDPDREQTAQQDAPEDAL